MNQLISIFVDHLTAWNEYYRLMLNLQLGRNLRKTNKKEVILKFDKFQICSNKHIKLTLPKLKNTTKIYITVQQKTFNIYSLKYIDNMDADF